MQGPFSRNQVISGGWAGLGLGQPGRGPRNRGTGQASDTDSGKSVAQTGRAPAAPAAAAGNASNGAGSRGSMGERVAGKDPWRCAHLGSAPCAVCTSHPPTNGPASLRFSRHDGARRLLSHPADPMATRRRCPGGFNLRRACIFHSACRVSSFFPFRAGFFFVFCSILSGQWQYYVKWPGGKASEVPGWREARGAARTAGWLDWRMEAEGAGLAAAGG